MPRGAHPNSRAALLPFQRKKGDPTFNKTGRSYPARVIPGTVIIVEGGRVSAFWHAWSEIYTGSHWRLADATPIDEAEHVHGIRSAAVEDEGMELQPGTGRHPPRSRIARISLSNE